MSATYFDSVTSTTAYHQYKRKGGASTSATGSLDALGSVPTSGWGAQQLLACRVLVAAASDPNTLPVFASHKTEEFTKTLRRSVRVEEPTNAATTVRSDSPRDRAFLQLEKLCRGPGNTSVPHEHRRVWIDGDAFGQLWAALDRVRPKDGQVYTPRADAAGIHDPITPRKHASSTYSHTSNRQETSSSPGPSLPTLPTAAPVPDLPSSPPVVLHLPPGRRQASGRVSKPPSRPGYTSAHDKVFSSSPSSSSVISDPHSNYAGDQGPSAEDRLYPEVLTVRFASAFIRHALPWLPSQDDASADPVIIFDDCPACHTTSRLGTSYFTSQDDGGLVLYADGKREGRVALLEAKRVIDRPVHGTPSLSDDCLGQVVGEALAARLVSGAWSGPENCIIVILAARHSVRFLQVEISEEYVSQLVNRAKDEQAPFTEYIRVRATQWFDLRHADHRCETILNLAAIAALARSIATTGEDD